MYAADEDDASDLSAGSLDEDNYYIADEPVEALTLQRPLSDVEDDNESEFSAGSLDDDDYYVAEKPFETPTWQRAPSVLNSITVSTGGSSSQVKNSSREVYRGQRIVSDTANDQKDPWIRLLQIRPDAFDHPLRCKLLKRRLWDAGQYYALSYSWGEEGRNSSVRIECQDQQTTSFAISARLHSALRRLRDESCVVNVWVDAICINQDDDVERSEQVHVMAQIYNQASEVRIWLGEGFSISEDNRVDSELLWSCCHLPHPWWTRLWVVQECAYAQECPIVMLADRLITLEQFIDHWRHVASSADPICGGVLQTHLELLQMPFQVWKAQQQSNRHRLPLVRRLEETMDRQCADPRDRIYALLSLIDEREAKQLRPNYHKSFSELWWDVAEVLGYHPLLNDWASDVLVYLCAGEDCLVSFAFSSGKKSSSEWSDALNGALGSGDKRPLTLLLQQRGNEIVEKRNAILNAACKAKQIEVIKILTGQNPVFEALINSDRNKGRAATLGNYTESLLLLSQPSSTANKKGLETACRLGHTAIVQSLLQGIKSEDDNLGDALDAASFAGHAEIVELLLENGAELDARGRTYSDAIQGALVNGHADLARLLLAKLGDFDVHGNYYVSILQDAFVKGHSEVAKLLLEKGVDNMAPAGFHDDALQLAAAGGNVAVVQMLLDRGANINACGGSFGNALCAASAEGHIAVVQLLLDKGANLHAQGGYYGDALHVASMRAQVTTVRLLIDKGANVNTRGYYGNALHAAIIGQSTEAATLLVDAGVDVDAAGGEECHGRKARDMLADLKATMSVQRPNGGFLEILSSTETQDAPQVYDFDDSESVDS